MAIVHLLLAMVAVLAGFIGLVILIKGFVDKSNKFIKLGTLLFSVMLIIGVLGGFCAGRHCMNSKRCHDQERCDMMMKCMQNCNGGMMSGCASMDSTTADSNGMQVITKVIMDKECMKKCDMKCDKSCKKACPGEKK